MSKVRTPELVQLSTKFESSEWTFCQFPQKKSILAMKWPTVDRKFKSRELVATVFWDASSQGHQKFIWSLFRRKLTFENFRKNCVHPQNLSAWKTKTAMKRPKTGRMEVLLDGEYRFFYEDSDFEVEIGAGWPKMAQVQGVRTPSPIQTKKKQPLTKHVKTR